jgi:[ribosomal protein S18]-alanine N-acetyltransferase
MAESRMDDADIVLGFADQRDAQTLALMSRDLIETGLGWAYRKDRIARLIGNPEAAAIVARDGDHPIGFAIMTFGDERAHLVLLAVRPTHRQRGIARRLLGWLVDSALTAGMASIHVELRVENDAARTLYHAAGFAETLRVPGYYAGRETAIRMMRLLRPPDTAETVWRWSMLDRP